MPGRGPTMLGRVLLPPATPMAGAWIGNAVVGNSATSVTLDFTTCPVGEWMLAIIALGDSQASNPLHPSGWIEVKQGPEGTSGASSSRLVVWARLKQPNDTTQQFNWPTSCNFVAQPMSWLGCDPQTPFLNVSYNPHSAGTTYATSSITPSGNSRVAAIFFNRTTTSIGTFVQPPQMQKRTDISSLSNAWCILSTADTIGVAPPSSQSYTATSTVSSSHGGAITFELVPVGAGPLVVGPVAPIRPRNPAPASPWFKAFPFDTTSIASSSPATTVGDIPSGSLGGDYFQETVTFDVVVTDVVLGGLAGDWSQEKAAIDIFATDVAIGSLGGFSSETVVIDTVVSDVALGALGGSSSETVTFDVVVSDVALGSLGGSSLETVAFDLIVVDLVSGGLGGTVTTEAQSNDSGGSDVAIGALGGQTTESVTIDVIVTDLVQGGLAGATLEVVTFDVVSFDTLLAGLAGLVLETVTIVTVTDVVISDVVLGGLASTGPVESVTASGPSLDTTINDTPIGVLAGLTLEHIIPIPDVIVNITATTTTSTINVPTVTSAIKAIAVTSVISSLNVAVRIVPATISAYLEVD